MQNNCRTIHETVIKDIINVVSDINNAEFLPGILSNKSYRSVAQAAEKLTLVFPVFVSSSIPIDNAIMVSRAIERKCATMMQMLFSAICISNATDAMDYISKFHGNLDADEISVDDFITQADRIDRMMESAGNKPLFFEKDAKELLKESLKTINYTFGDDFNESSLNNYRVKHTANGLLVTAIHEAPTPRDLADGAKYVKDTIDANRNRVFTTDIKKANELVPTMMVINFVNADTQISTSAVIGIKAKLYPIDAEDAINRIMLKNKDNQGFHNFIRATTREISFWKDFVFAIDKAKIDALSSAKRGSSSKIWKVLERRALKGRIKRYFGLNNDAAAISTLVISREDAELLKKNYSINVDKPNIIRPIMDSYSLMGFAIVDEAMETVKFIFDTGDDNYENISFTHLEREAADGSYRKVVNLISKMAR